MEDSLRKFLERWTDRFIDIYKDELGSSDLADSVVGKVSVSSEGFDIELDLNDYWVYVEEGRSPGKFPPLEAMLKFTRNIIPKPYQLPSGKQVIPSNNQLAFLIGRKIARDGYEGNHKLSETKDYMREELKSGIKRILREEVKKVLK